MWLVIVNRGALWEELQGAPAPTHHGGGRGEESFAVASSVGAMGRSVWESCQHEKV